MMKNSACKQLGQLIADMLTPKINDICATKEGQFFYEFEMPPTDNEVMNYYCMLMP